MSKIVQRRQFSRGLEIERHVDSDGRDSFYVIDTQILQWGVGSRLWLEAEPSEKERDPAAQTDKGGD